MYDTKWITEKLIRVRLEQYEKGEISRETFIEFSALDIEIAKDVERIITNINRRQ